LDDLELVGWLYDDIIIDPSPIQHHFITSPATIVVLIGPQGEGKTWAGAVAMLHFAQKWKSVGLPLPARGCIIRDTHENIKRMTVPSITEALQELVIWKDDYHKLTFVDGSAEIDLFGMDDEASLTKLQGAEYAVIWIEEPAPIIEKGQAGLSLNVFNVALSRVARQLKQRYSGLGISPRLQVTMNPADESHWTYQEFIEAPRFPSKEFPDIMLEVYNIPYGENRHLSELARQSVRAAYAKDPALYARYVEGKWAFVMSGVAVTPEYNPDLHRSKVRLTPAPGVPIYRGWDGGLNPSCVFVQVLPTGRMVVLASLIGQNMGMRQFIRLYVKPKIKQNFREFASRRDLWIDVGDPAMLIRDSSSSDQWAARVIEEELKTTFIPGEMKWPPRLEAIKQALSTIIDGSPALLLDPQEGLLHRALRGGWHYKATSNNSVTSDIPIKNVHSHPADALTYVLAHVMGVTGVAKRKKIAWRRWGGRRPSWRTA